jgi:branched-chain amino acid aminotransferase
MSVSVLDAPVIDNATSVVNPPAFPSFKPSTMNIRRVENSRIGSVDMNNLPFGRVFSDHMFIARCHKGEWETPEIVPYGKLEMSPANASLNYGQSVFEGMKAFRGKDGRPVLFRPEDNWERMNFSATRMCMPHIPEAIFMEGLKALITLDEAWIPTEAKGSLYIRPIYFASDEVIGVHSSDSYTFAIITSPSGPYYSKPVRVLVEETYVRAANGGTGDAKAAGNYAAGMLPDKLAKEQGYQSLMWLDARQRKYIEECGTMNVFFVVEDNTVLTPSLSGSILHGITRDSVIQLLEHHGYRVEERRIAIQEIADLYYGGLLTDAFGTGTAATIAHIAEINYGGNAIMLPPVEERVLSNWLARTLSDIRAGRAVDTFGWTLRL